MKRVYTIILSIVIIISMSGRAWGQPDSADYLRSPMQITFLFPPFSTNGMDNANYVNDLSLNLFVGVSGGVDGVEVGGFINVDRFYVNGFQAAGFGNTVGGSVEGVQLSGFYNAVGGDFRYVQGAGFVNVTGGNQAGIQGAGFANVVGNDVYGFQGSGFINVAGGRVTGIQGAGFMNVSGDTTTGLQASGFMNVAGNFNKGIQVSGFGNVAGNGKVTVQGSGFLNVADEVSGLQAAGFLNKAGFVRGVQAAGFINICDSIDGVPIAPISIVKHGGYHSFELAASETQYISASFRLGIPRFYTIYSFGKPSGPSTRWMYGAGIGSQLDLSGRSFLNVELMAEQELWIGDSRTAPYPVYQSRLNMNNQLRISYGIGLGNFAELFIGPTLNLSVAHTHPADDVYIPWEPIAPDWAFVDMTYESTYHQLNYAFWIGLRGGIRF